MSGYMPANVWFDKAFEKLSDRDIKGRRDKIPAECEGMEGIVLLSLSGEEVKKVFGTFNHAEINATGLKSAKLDGTDIIVDVVTIRPVQEKSEVK